MPDGDSDQSDGSGSDMAGPSGVSDGPIAMQDKLWPTSKAQEAYMLEHVLRISAGKAKSRRIIMSDSDSESD